ncbi:ergothioneine biosynthesis protein EgtB [Pseudonocardia phyllosphaerae]|uniref:ergothioneine biosynthesis protein EgtB n=1 Tax=Pseudonocardia phyllosphaerae TaxID=3390502 RepID=UPI00397DA44D
MTTEAVPTGSVQTGSVQTGSVQTGTVPTPVTGPAAPGESPEAVRERVAALLSRSRARSSGLTDLDDADMQAQHSPLMSPLVWDLAHIGSMEELWLVRDVGGREPLRPEIDGLYDAFQHTRSSRVTLPLLTPAEAREYVDEVRDKALDALHRSPLRGRAIEADGFAFGMIVQHEQQHDETMLATHQLREGAPLLHAPAPPAAAQAVDAAAETHVPAGPFEMGTSTEPWALDNERPAHTVDLPAYVIETYPVTNARFAAFVEAGGYDDPRWWTGPGWAARVAEDLTAPRFWTRDADGTWWRRRFGVVEPVPGDEPVQHVTFHEAQAFARWAGKRLPTEAEWEKAARYDPATGRSRRYPWGDDDPTPERANLGQRHLQPAPAGAYPAGASALGVQQLVGDVWEWCDSGWEPYPGFSVFPYPEYSQVFFGGDYRVLRGGSFGTDPSAIRATFRNWDHPVRRQIFSGFRLARDASPADGR